MKSGRFRSVNTIKKDMDNQYDEKNEQARQLGADYVISGTLYSIEKKAEAYKLNIELISVKTGLIEWADSIEVFTETILEDDIEDAIDIPTYIF